MKASYDDARRGTPLRWRCVAQLGDFFHFYSPLKPETAALVRLTGQAFCLRRFGPPVQERCWTRSIGAGGGCATPARIVSRWSHDFMG